jgi:hypothetical protein
MRERAAIFAFAALSACGGLVIFEGVPSPMAPSDDAPGAPIANGGPETGGGPPGVEPACSVDAGWPVSGVCVPPGAKPGAPIPLIAKAPYDVGPIPDACLVEVTDLAIRVTFQAWSCRSKPVHDVNGLTGTALCTIPALDAGTYEVTLVGESPDLDRLDGGARRRTIVVRDAERDYDYCTITTVPYRKCSSTNECRPATTGWVCQPCNCVNDAIWGGSNEHNYLWGLNVYWARLSCTPPPSGCSCPATRVECVKRNGEDAGTCKLLPAN